MSTGGESILFLLGSEMAVTAQQPDEYLVQSDPSPVITDVRDSEPPPPLSAPLSGSDDPPSSRAPPSSRSRGPHIPTVFDVVEFGVPSPRTAARLDHGWDEHGDYSALPTIAKVPVGMRESIMNIAVDDRDGPASNRIAVQERIQNRSRIRDLASTLVRYHSVGILNSAFHVPAQVRAAALYRQANAMCWELSTPWIDPPFVIEVAGYNSVYQFPVERASMRDGLMLTPLPREVVRLRRRWGRRAGAPDGSAADVTIEGATDPLHARPLRDVSFTGLSFWNDPAHLVIHPGTRVEEAAIVPSPGAAPIKFAGEVSFVARDKGGRGDLCGMRVDAQAPDAVKQRWRDFVGEVLYPTTRPGHGFYDAVWRLYGDAGYFNLSGKDPGRFDRLRACFFRNAQRIDDNPNLGCVVVWPVGEEVLAAISMLKIYKGSWFVYQLAKKRGDAPDGASSRQILRDLHLRAYEHAQLDPGLTHCIGYPQDKPIWSRAVHHDLPRRFITAGLAGVTRFRALEVSCSAPHPDLPRGLDIGQATSGEIELLLRQLGATHPRSYLEAYDLTPDRIDLADIKRLWAEAGLSREREILVARRGGQPVAALVMEDAEEGLHLFRLLDVARPFPLVADLDEAAPAMDALVATAKAWYEGRGKPAFCCFLEEDLWLTPETLRTVEDMGLADMTILSAQLLPEMLEHLIEVTAPREN